MTLPLTPAKGTIPGMAQVIAANFQEAVIFIDDGRTLPIIMWFDSDNLPTHDFDEAVSFVAGAETEWFQGRIADWRKLTIH